MQNRFKSKVVWLAVLAQVLLVVGLYMPDLSSQIKTVGTAIIEILTLFAFLNNPTEADKF
jgi:uncharacterized membrane protein